MKKSKVTAILLVGAMAMSILAACGGNTESNSLQNTHTEEKTSESTNSTSFEEVTVIDNDKYSMKITGIAGEPQGAYSLNAVYENKLPAPKEGAEGKDRNRLTFLVREAYVNDYEYEIVAGADGIEAGTSLENTIDFNQYQFDAKNITDITKIELVVAISNTDDWSQYYEEAVSVVFYPQGESKYPGQSYVVQSTDEVLADNDSVKIVSLGEYIPKDNVYGIRLYVENKTANEIRLGFEEEKIDDVAVDSHTTASILPGRQDYVLISWNEADINEAKVTGFDAAKTENATFKLRVYNADLTDGIMEYLNESFTVTP